MSYYLAKHVAQFVHYDTCCNTYIKRVFGAILWNLYTAVRSVYHLLLYAKNFMPHDNSSLLILR